MAKRKKQEYRKSVADTLAASSKDSAAFWKNVNKLAGSNTKKQPCDNISMQEWYDHFENVFRQCDETEHVCQPVVNTLHDEADLCLDKEIAKQQIPKTY